MIYLMHVCSTQVTLAGTAPGGFADAPRHGRREGLGTLAFSERGVTQPFLGTGQPGHGRRDTVGPEIVVTSAGHAEDLRGVDAPGGDGRTARVQPVPGGANDDTGIDVGPAWEGLGLRGNASAPMTFDTAVADGELLGEEGKGLDLMLGVVLPWFQLGSSAVSVGIAEGAVQAGVAHVTGAKLEHLGQTLIELPTVRARIGRSQTEVDAIGGACRTWLGG